MIIKVNELLFLAERTTYQYDDSEFCRSGVETPNFQNNLKFTKNHKEKFIRIE